MVGSHGGALEVTVVATTEILYALLWTIYTSLYMHHLYVILITDWRGHAG